MRSLMPRVLTYEWYFVFMCSNMLINYRIKISAQSMGLLHWHRLNYNPWYLNHNILEMIRDLYWPFIQGWILTNKYLYFSCEYSFIGPCHFILFLVNVNCLYKLLAENIQVNFFFLDFQFVRILWHKGHFFIRFSISLNYFHLCYNFYTFW